MSNITPESIMSDLRYLQLLSRSFPTIADASTEIINLEAILNLPKGTEHFLTDIHGEYEAFQHVLKNASGAVKRKVNEIFGHTLRESEKKEICTLIYYPEEKLQLIKEQEADLDDWYLITLNQLVKVCQNVSSKYTRSKVRKALPAFVIGILLLLLFGYKLQAIPVLGRLSTTLVAPKTVTGFFVLDALLAGDFTVAWDAFLHLLLPALALAVPPMVQDARILRSSLVDNSAKEYMAVSTGHGLPPNLLIRKYLLKPSATSAITTMGMDFASLMGNAFLVERIFNWPGISRYGINAMLFKDLNAICAVVLIIGITFFVVNLVVDLIVAALDPRMRKGGSK